MIAEELPQLPLGEDVMSVAVRSVTLRGFHGAHCAAASNAWLMGQYGRLVEELSEFLAASYMTDPSIDAVNDEAADVCVVCAQLLWLLNADVESAWDVNYAMEDLCQRYSLVMAPGQLWRALRKDDWAKAIYLLRVIVALVRHFALTDDLESAMRLKMARDEQRGRLHQGGPL